MQITAYVNSKEFTLNRLSQDDPSAEELIRNSGGLYALGQKRENGRNEDILLIAHSDALERLIANPPMSKWEYARILGADTIWAMQCDSWETCNEVAKYLEQAPESVT